MIPGFRKSWRCQSPSWSQNWSLNFPVWNRNWNCQNHQSPLSQRSWQDLQLLLLQDLQPRHLPARHPPCLNHCGLVWVGRSLLHRLKKNSLQPAWAGRNHLLPGRIRCFQGRPPLVFPSSTRPRSPGWPGRGSCSQSWSGLASGPPDLQYPCRASWNSTQNSTALNWNFHLRSSSVAGSLRTTKMTISPRSRKRVGLTSSMVFA